MTDERDSSETSAMDDGRSAARSGASDPAGLAADGGNGSLLAILDRLTGLLERSDLTELEVESGGTGLVLRKAAAIAPVPLAAGAPRRPGHPSDPSRSAAPDRRARPLARRSRRR